MKDLGLTREPFAKPQAIKAKTSLCNGKAAGPNDIVIKKCDFNNIILRFANKLMIDSLKPEQ